jgi:hypothetical protein
MASPFELGRDRLSVLEVEVRDRHLSAGPRECYRYGGAKPTRATSHNGDFVGEVGTQFYQALGSVPQTPLLGYAGSARYTKRLADTHYGARLTRRQAGAAWRNHQTAV